MCEVVFAIMPILTSTVGANISSCGARLSWLRSTIVAALGVALQKAFDDGLIANGDDIRHDRGVGREMGTKGTRAGCSERALARESCGVGVFRGPQRGRLFERLFRW